MKKIILFISILISFISCDNPYDECYYDERYYLTSYSRTGKDVFYADILLGCWQCDYNMIVGTNELKTINFKTSNKCDITMNQIRDIDRNTYTFNYLYDGKYIKFTRNGMTFSFRISGFLYPELYLQDSFGKYTIRKISAYGCN